MFTPECDEGHNPATWSAWRFHPKARWYLCDDHAGRFESWAEERPGIHMERIERR